MSVDIYRNRRLTSDYCIDFFVQFFSYFFHVFYSRNTFKLYSSPVRGGDVAGVSANKYSCSHGAQTNFGDLTPYLT
jgi:hypothetical protein